MKFQQYIALTACLVASSAFAAEESVVLAKKGHIPPVGTIHSKEMNMTMVDAVVNLTAAGQVMAGSMSRSDKGEETMEVLSPVKIRRILKSKTGEGKMSVAGQEQPIPSTPDALLGVAVIVEKDGEKWTASLEGTDKPTPEQEAALKKVTKEFGNEADLGMYGDTPRKPGDKWKVDPSKIGFSGGTDMKGDYTVEFIGMKEFQGVQCAELKATFDFSGKTEEEQEGAPSMGMNLKGEVTSHRSIKDMVDLDVNMNSTTTITGSPAPQVTMEIKGPMKMVQTVSVKRP